MAPFRARFQGGLLAVSAWNALICHHVCHALPLCPAGCLLEGTHGQDQSQAPVPAALQVVPSCAAISWTAQRIQGTNQRLDYDNGSLQANQILASATGGHLTDAESRGSRGGGRRGGGRVRKILFERQQVCHHGLPMHQGGQTAPQRPGTPKSLHRELGSACCCSATSYAACRAGLILIQDWGLGGYVAWAVADSMCCDRRSGCQRKACMRTLPERPLRNATVYLRHVLAERSRLCIIN